MAAEPRRIKVTPGSGLAELLAEARTEPVILDRAGDLYRLSPMNKEHERPSPEEVARSQEAIRKAAGGWKGLIDAEEFKAYLYERRHTANRPSVRL